MYTPPDGLLLERNGNLTMWKSKSLRLSYSLVESVAPLSGVVGVKLLGRQPD